MSSPSPTRRAVAGGLPVGRVSGVPVFLSPSTLLLVVFIALTYTRPGSAGRVDTAGGYLVAVAFAVLLLLSVFLHELGHCVVSQAVGVRVRSITLYMLGGVTTTESEAGDPARSFLITLAGPLVSLLLATVGALGGHALARGSAGRELVVDVTVVNLLVAVFNMLPGLPLDGGHLVRAGVWRLTGRPALATRAAGWAGRGVAVLVLAGGLAVVRLGGATGFANLFWAALLAAFIWVGATQAMRGAIVSERLPRLQARHMARPAIAVPSDLPLAEALRRLAEEEAGAIVVVDRDGHPEAVVVEQAVSATPEKRRPWVTVGAVARSVAGLTLDAELSGSDMVSAIQAHPAAEYVVVDGRGALVGVLTTADVAGVLRPVPAR